MLQNGNEDPLALGVTSIMTILQCEGHANRSSKWNLSDARWNFAFPSTIVQRQGGCNALKKTLEGSH